MAKKPGPGFGTSDLWVAAFFGALTVAVLWLFCSFVSRPEEPLFPPIELSPWDFQCYDTHIEKFGAEVIHERELCDVYIRKYSAPYDAAVEVGYLPKVVRE